MAILPGSTLGMLGGGQLGRMFVIAARTLGYDVIVLDRTRTARLVDLRANTLQETYDDTAALDYLAQHCAAVTTEFENIPAVALAYLAKSVPVHPSATVLHIAQHRKLEKEFFRELGLNTADFIALESDADLDSARDFAFPAILKTAMLGYDGKGQVVCQSFDELKSAFEQVGKKPCLLEQRIDLSSEVSVVLCRSQAGKVTCFPIAENSHANGILDSTLVPASITKKLASEAIDAATRIADGLDYCGVLAVEFFVSTDKQVLVNEMAPRPHNSGHYTLDACVTSQFEQQVRMVCVCLPAPVNCIRQSRCGICWVISGPTTGYRIGMRF